MSDKPHSPKSDDQELTSEQLAEVAGGTQGDQTDKKIPIDVDEVGSPPPGTQTPGQDNSLGVSIQF